MSNPQNLMINVRCPFCHRALVVALSGFIGELASRAKQCKYCGREYHVLLLASTSDTDNPSDGQIAELKNRLSYLQRQRDNTAAELLLKVETCIRLNNEAMDEARKQRANFGSN